MEYKDYICKDQDGNFLVSVDDMDEETLSDDPSFTHCLAVVKAGEEYLLGRNKWRNRFEIFGGCVEKGETANVFQKRFYLRKLGLEIIGNSEVCRSEGVKVVEHSCRCPGCGNKLQ